MEIVTWTGKTFHQIPEQDNPAFSTDDCIMICRDANMPHLYQVLEIKDQHELDTSRHGLDVGVERVLHLGLFWDIGNAHIFAEAFIAADEQNSEEGS